MIIAKKDYCPLKWSDFVENCPYSKFNKFTIAYCTYNRDKEVNSPDPLGFLDVRDNIKELKEYIEWLNENEYAAIIYCSRYQDYNSFPFFFGKNEFCLAFEGFMSQDYKNIVDKFQDLTKYINNPTDPNILWMLDESSTFRDQFVILSNKAEITFLNGYHKYEDNGISYCIYGKPSKYFKSENLFCHS